MARDLEKGKYIEQAAEPLTEKPPQQSLISKIRLRQPGQTAEFTHAAGHLKTDDSCIVEFDGPDDMYNPSNWSFGKKALTTILYGMTTMGAAWASAAYVHILP